MAFFDKSMQTRIANYTRQVKNRALRQGTLTLSPTARTSAQPSTALAKDKKRPREPTAGDEDDAGDEVEFEDVLDYDSGDEISIIVLIAGSDDPVIVAHGSANTQAHTHTQIEIHKHICFNIYIYV